MDRSRRRKRNVLIWLGGLGIGLQLVLAGLTGGALWPVLSGLAVMVTTLVAGHRFMRLAPSVPVLAWHSVSPEPDWLPWADNLSIRPEVFAAQMQALARWGWHPVSSHDLALWMEGGTTLPERSVVLHFDDGYRDNARAAVPVMREHGFPATIFIASDFIASTERDDWKGYLSGPELRALDADPMIEIACHGRDHARLPVPGPAQGCFTADGWRRHATLIWGQIPGNKAEWFTATSPAPFELGAAVPASDSALTARALLADGTQETEAEQAVRIEQDLRIARHRLEEALGRDVDHLCWPFDRCSPLSVAAAKRAGFRVMTGGRGYNRPGTPIHEIARMHITDRALGGGPLWSELLVFRAKLNVAAGNNYWAPVVWAAAFLRSRRFRSPTSPVDRRQAESSPEAHLETGT